MKVWIAVAVFAALFAGAVTAVAVVAVAGWHLSNTLIEDDGDNDVAPVAPPPVVPVPVPVVPDVPVEPVEPVEPAPVPPPNFGPRPPRFPLTPTSKPRPAAVPRPGTVPANVFPPGVANANGLLRKHAAGLTVQASSEWTTWPAAKLTDGNVLSSWFSGPENRKPGPHWVRVTFPVPVTVSRVTLLGNREPQWSGYAISAGRVVLRSGRGEELADEAVTAVGPKSDFDFHPADPVANVRSIEFRVTRTPGSAVGMTDVALAEVLVE